jgi:hypothetical protein
MKRFVVRWQALLEAQTGGRPSAEKHDNEERLRCGNDAAECWETGATMLALCYAAQRGRLFLYRDRRLAW